MAQLKLGNLNKYSWDEVKKHNKREDCWIVLEREVEGQKKGLILDITEWAPKHPGGTIIYDGAGGDCTIMFWSYHPLTFIDNCNWYLNRFVIGEVENYKNIYEVGSDFQRELKKRVEAKIPKSDRCSDWRMNLKTALICLTIAITFYFGWLKGQMWAVLLFGFGLSQTGVNMMHDATHSAYSKSQLVCNLMAFTFNMAGGNFLAYRRGHAFGHHAYTNHLEYDFAIDSYFPVVKLNDKLNSRWFHRLQHIYIVPLYLFGIFRFWLGDFKEMTKLYNYPKRDGPVTGEQWVVAVLGKVFFLSWYLGLHFYMFPWQKALLDCVLICMIMGFFAVIFFAVNHWTEKATTFSNQELIDNTSDWAVLQILSSTNFANDSFFWTHLSGGLNLQMEHHLFPGLIHTRLSLISPILRDLCIENGIDYDYQCYPSFWAAFASNFAFLRTLGRGEKRRSFPEVKVKQAEKVVVDLHKRNRILKTSGAAMM